MGRKDEFSGGAGLPEFITLGSDDHPLGKRSIWKYPDDRLEVMSEAFGMKAKFEYGPGEGTSELERIRAAYDSHDVARQLEDIDTTEMDDLDDDGGWRPGR